MSKKPTLTKSQGFIIKYLLIFSSVSDRLGENQKKFAEIFGDLENFKRKEYIGNLEEKNFMRQISRLIIAMSKCTF